MLAAASLSLLALLAFDQTGGDSGSQSGPLTGSNSGTPASVTRQWDLCGGPTKLTLMCASVKVSVEGTTTTVDVFNFSGAGSILAPGYATVGSWVITSVGFDGVANSAGAFTTSMGTTSGPWYRRTATTTIPRQWSRFDDKTFGGGVNVDFGIYNGSGIGGGIASSCAAVGTLPGGNSRLWMTDSQGCDAYSIADATRNEGWFQASFKTVETWNPNGDGVAVFFKGQNGPNGQSYECIHGGTYDNGVCVDADGLYGGDPAIAQIEGVDPQQQAGAYVTPEPSTFVLTGSIVGLLCLPPVRRRIVTAIKR